MFRAKVYGTGKGKVVFFFCPFNIPRWHLAAPGMAIWRLTRGGYRVVAYDYSTKIATVNVQVTVEQFELILADAAKRLAAYKRAGETEFYAFGTSMGTNFAANLAARHPEITKVVLNLSYSDITQHIVALPALRTTPRAVWDRYIAASGGEAGMRQALDPYAPLRLVEQLKNRRVLLFLARADRILQYPHTRVLLDHLRAAGCQVTYYENLRLSHSLAGLRNGLDARRYLDFFGWSQAVPGAKQRQGESENYSVTQDGVRET